MAEGDGPVPGKDLVNTFQDSNLPCDSDEDSVDGARMKTTTRRRHRSFTDRRRNSQSLPRLHIPELPFNLLNAPRRTRLPMEQVEKDTSNVFEHFVYEEVQKELNVDASSYLESFCRSPEFTQSSAWRQYGRDLRVMADDFAQTYERKSIQERARRTNVDTLQREDFMDMLAELFQDGRNSRERIMVFLFFCTDLIIAAIKKKAMDIFNKIFNWCLEFVRTKIADFVARNGGWSQVLGSSGRWVTGFGVAIGIILFSFFCYKKYTSV